MSSTQLDTLTQVNLDDLVASFGWEKYPLPAFILRKLFIGAARKFSGQMLAYDECVGALGLAKGSRQTLRNYYVQDVRVQGGDLVPRQGPALFLSNHPGMADTLSLFAAIQRPDLNIIAIQRPFLVSLANVTKNLFYISDAPAERMRAVRQVAAHLRGGGSVLTFPAGEIEPDPDVYPGASNSLNQWTDSAGVFLRFAPQTKIVPVLVRHVVWEKTAHHWLTRLKRTRMEREKLAAALQLLAMVTRGVRPTIVRVSFAKPITLDEIGSTESKAIHQVVLHRMRALIDAKPAEADISAL